MGEERNVGVLVCDRERGRVKGAHSPLARLLQMQSPKGFLSPFFPTEPQLLCRRRRYVLSRLNRMQRKAKEAASQPV